MHTKIKYKKFGTLAVLLSSSLALNACMGGTSNGAAGTMSNQVSQNEATNKSEASLVMSQLGQLPAGSASYPLKISNLGADAYSLKSIRVENLSKRNKESGDILRVESIYSASKIINARGEYTLKLTTQAGKVGAVRLIVELENSRTHEPQALQQVISISSHNYTNQGITYDDNNLGLSLSNGYYDFSLPILLDKDFVELSSTNGVLECLNGYNSGGGCVLHFNGYATESTNYHFKLVGETALHEHISVDNAFLFKDTKSSVDSEGFFGSGVLDIPSADTTGIVELIAYKDLTEVEYTLRNPENLDIDSDSTECDSAITANHRCSIHVYGREDSKVVSGFLDVTSVNLVTGERYRKEIQIYRSAVINRVPNIDFIAPANMVAYKNDIAKFDIALKNIGTVGLRNPIVSIPQDDCGRLSFSDKEKLCDWKPRDIGIGNSPEVKTSLYFKPIVNTATSSKSVTLSIGGTYSTNSFTQALKTISYAAQELDSNILDIKVDQPVLNVVPGTGSSKTAKVHLSNLLQATSILIDKVSLVDPTSGNTLNIPGLELSRSACSTLQATESCSVLVTFAPKDSQTVPKTAFKVMNAFRVKSRDFYKSSESLYAIADENQGKVTLEYKGPVSIGGNLTVQKNANGTTTYGAPIGSEAALEYELKNNLDKAVKFTYSSDLINGGPATGDRVDNGCTGEILPHHTCSVKLVRKIIRNVNPLFFPMKYGVVTIDNGTETTIVSNAEFPNPKLNIYGYAVNSDGTYKVEVSLGTKFDEAKFGPDKIKTIGTIGDEFVVYATVKGYNPSPDLPVDINSVFDATGDGNGLHGNALQYTRIDSCERKLEDYTSQARCSFVFKQVDPIQYNTDFAGNNPEHYFSEFNKSNTIKGFYNHFPDIRYVTFTAKPGVTLRDFIGTGTMKVFNYFLGSERREYDETPIVNGRKFDYFNCSKDTRRKLRYTSENIPGIVSNYYAQPENLVELGLLGHYSELPSKDQYSSLVYERCNKKLAQRVTANWDTGGHICGHCIRPWFTRGGGWVENTMK